jgi:hypothetical protein
MKRVAGQAAWILLQVFHRTGMVIMTAFFLAMLGAGVLAYRLSQGPMQIPWALSRLANAASGADVDIDIGRATLSWAGYKSGSRAPLFLGLGDITIRNAGGALLASIPQAQLACPPGALFGAGAEAAGVPPSGMMGDRAPIYVSSENAHVMGSTAPISLLAGIRLSAAFALASADIWVTLGAGQLGPPGLGEPITGGKFLLRLTPNDARLTNATLNLTPFGQSAPVIKIAAAAHRSGAWHGTVTLSAAGAQAQDLSHYWPAQLVPMTRGWVTRNITAGTAQDASFTLGLSAQAGLNSVSLDSATGGFKAEGLTLIWLPGVQPLTGLNGTFTLTDADNIDITADSARLGGIAIAAGHMHIAGVSQPDQIATLAVPVSGTMQSAFAVLNGPNLGLLKTVPPAVAAATGNMTGMVNVTLPLQGNIAPNDVKLNVATLLTNVTLPLPVQGLTLLQGKLNVDATLQGLSIKGGGQISGEPASTTVTVDFANAAGTPVTLDLKTTATVAMLRQIGLDPDGFVRGKMPVVVHVATTAMNSGSLTVKADLTPASLTLPVFGWNKPSGKPGTFSFAAGINGNKFSGIDRIDSIVATAPDLDIDTTMAGSTILLSHVRIGNTEGSGKIVPPAADGQPWTIVLSGNALDFSSVVNPPQPKGARPTTPKPQPPAPQPAMPQKPTGFLWNATAHFGRLLLAQSPEPALDDFDFTGDGQGNFIFHAKATALLGDAKPMSLSMAPEPGSVPGAAETISLQTGDGGTLLRALGAFDDLSGGELDFSARFGLGTPVTGVTRINNFRLLKAPALGKILQAITVLGIPEAVSGPGLEFSRLIAPFSIDNQKLTLMEARAYSASLGFTASGTIDLNASTYDIHGTVVPGYALNVLPGKIPLIGKLFSPEKGGGLFAMRYAMTGPVSDPDVKINPLSALTPGFLRGIFGLGKKTETK